MNEDAFWEGIGLERALGSEALLFIHGYNVSFDDAVYRTAQLAIDLNFAGPALLYSWPSNARTLSYVSDKDRSLAAVGSLKLFLRALASRLGALSLGKLHVIAHSMGNNALVHALAELAAEAHVPAPLLDTLIMAAPDLDRREFTRLADAVGTRAHHLTLYAARSDRALAAAEGLHHEPRLGDAAPVFIRRGIDSIDASDIVEGFMRHSYFGDFRLLDDIERIIRGDRQMPRFGLAGVPDSATATHWTFKRAD